MPHKTNPILSENLTGLSRLVRSYVVPALENIALWHERDISHSSVERIIIPDSTHIIEYMLDKMTNLFENLIVYPDNMMDNINKTNGLIFSQEVLLSLVKKGITREDAYQMVQKNAMKVWEDKIDFKTLLFNDESISKILSKEEIDNLFDLNKILKNIKKVFERLNIKW